MVDIKNLEAKEIQHVEKYNFFYPISRFDEVGFSPFPVLAADGLGSRC
jgi:hypothetical protein